MDPLALPAKDKLREIAARQDAQEKEILEKRKADHMQSDDRQAAAELIQRVPGKEASQRIRTVPFDKMVGTQYQTSTRPRSKDQQDTHDPASGHSSTQARSKWKKAGAIARQAENDDTSETEGEDGMSGAELEKYRRKKRDLKSQREAYARTMGLEYFLEMVDQKHRYGSSLRAYHRVWQESDSKENFFYWLDYGEGKSVELEDRPRERLEREQIKYLSREERQRYLITIDKGGLFRWAKDGELITTSPDYKDSIDGVVPADSKRPTWREHQQGKEEASSPSESEGDSGSVSGISVGSNEDASRYVNQEFRDAKGVQKLKHISAGALMNNLLRKTTKKNTWIFVADTSFRVYIGIKQSGAFQHSSFLHGARVSAAGLIRIKRGQLRKLDPLSGHYAPPAENFRGFVHSLRDAGADMSRVSISRSYAILLGLESYVGAKQKVKKSEQKVKDMIHPEAARKREADKKDKSKSAEKEREILERQAKENGLHEESSRHVRVMQKLHIRDSSDSTSKDQHPAVVQAAPRPDQ